MKKITLNIDYSENQFTEDGFKLYFFSGNELLHEEVLSKLPNQTTVFLN